MDEKKMSKTEIIQVTIENLKEALPAAVLADKMLGYIVAASIKNLEVVKGMKDEEPEEPEIRIEEVTEDDA